MTLGATRTLTLSDKKRALLETILKREGAAATQGVAAIPRRPANTTPPLSFAQHRLWFLEELEPCRGLYNVPCVARLRGPLDHAAFERSLNMLVARHESLRTTFEASEGKPYQVVAESLVLRVGLNDLRQLPYEEREVRVREVAEADARLPFDLVRGPLLRARLLRLDQQEHVLLLNLHHIITDGWSIGVLMRELAQLYPAARVGQPDPLGAAGLHYPDYAVWQREHVTGELLENQLGYWRERLAGMPSTLELPTDRPRPAKQSYRGATVTRRLPADLTRRLQALADAHGATLFMVLLAGCQSVLARHTGQLDIAVGTPVANRDRRELEGVIGFFANTLVMRTDLGGAPTFVELLERVKETCLGAYAHQDVPFERLVEELRPERDASHSPLVQTVFTFDRMPAEALRFGDVQAELMDVHSRTAKFDLTLLVNEGPGGLSATAEYATDLFDAATMERLLAHYERFLDQVVDDPAQRVDAIDLLTSAERQQVVTDWNATATDYPHASCVQELVEEQAARTPTEVAVVSGEQQLTYGDLNSRANRLAHYLRGLGVGPETRVGVCLDRSAEAIVVLVGILKAGGAYVPLDPTYPAERLSHMLADSAIAVLISQSGFAAQLPPSAAQLVCLDDADRLAAIAASSAGNPVTTTTPDNLAYVIYTSGSTGTPKGAAVTHRNVVRLVRATHYARFTPDEVFLQFAPLAFDASTFEVWGPLLNGARLVIPPSADRLSLSDLGETLREYGVTTLWLTAGLFQQMVETQLDDLRGVRQLLAGGDVLSMSHVQSVLRELPDCQLINGYGPTECTTFSACYPIRRDDDTAIESSVPIGGPIANASLYVLDHRMQPQPVGVPGELFIGGVGVARGYLNRPELTAERFVPSQFGSAPGERLYRTGDLVRWRPDGTLEFLGRLDHQVKIRGFRIELGEIESALRQHSGVQDTVVIARQAASGDKRLVAYVVLTDPESRLSMDELRQHLRGLLPEYMVPGAFVTMAALPLSPNGKVDRRALPEPEFGERGDRQAYVAPSTPAEQALVGIWSAVLGIPAENVGVHDNFFELGGHSLLATQVVARVRDLLQTELPLRAMFEAPTIAAMAERCVAARATPGVPTPRLLAGHRPAELPLSYAQQRLWFLDQLEPGGSVYDVPCVVALHGPLDPVAFEHSLNMLVERHESLRTTFETADGQPRQVIADALCLHVGLDDLSELPSEERDARVHELAAADADMPFDLVRGPLLRARLLRLDVHEHVLLLNLHHIITDGWSMGVLMRELSQLYPAAQRGQSESLEPLALQFADYAVWQRDFLTGQALEKQLGYWRERLRGMSTTLDLPADRPRPSQQSYRGATVTRHLRADLTGRLEALADANGATLYMVLLAAYQSLLSRYTGQLDICVGTPIANRERRELEDIIGFFANTLVMRTDLSGRPRFDEVLRRVADTCLEAYAHQDLPFERLVDDLQPQRDASHAPLVQTVFTFDRTQVGALSFGELQAELLEVDSRTSKFDITLSVDHGPRGLRATAEYSTDLFDVSTIERLLAHYERLLEHVVDEPGRRVTDIDLLTSAERQQILLEWNATDSDYPRGSTLHELVAAQAARSPGAIAVVDQHERLTYADLNERANRLAHHLRSLGAGPETRVGLCLERSAEAVMALLAILKAGGAYVPLDPTYPVDRLSHMLADSDINLLITRRLLAEQLPPTAARLILLDDAREVALIQAASPTNPITATTPDNLANVIYTSGSTGMPKGAAITHRGVVRLISWHNRAFDITPDDRGPHLASLSFDATGWDIWPYLICGASVYVPDEETRLNAHRMQDWFLEHNISVAFITTALAEVLLGMPWPAHSSLRTLLTGGDLLRRYPTPELPFDVVNNYGPTECSIVSTSGPVPAYAPAARPDEAPDIGRPISDTTVYVLDARMQPLPVGVAGELLIGGDAVARGYLNRPELTAERFVPDPFAVAPGGRLYRSGDLVRWRPDGALEFLGRLDNQVKIRGFRIELGEIESALGRHPRIQEVVVVARQVGPGDKRLVAYFVSVDVDVDTPPSAQELREHLRGLVPDYMLPSAWVQLEALPMSPNGKVDRRALPEPQLGERTDRQPYVRPSTPAEQVLADIWAEILGVPIERVGVHDNFFDLGGDSILSIRVVARATQAGVPLTPRQLFQHQTVATLARVAGEAPPVVEAHPAAPNRPLPLTAIQHWFFEQDFPNPHQWNTAYVLEAREPVEPALIEQAMRCVLDHHDALRLRFRRTDDGWVQTYAAADAGDELPFEAVDLSRRTRAEQDGIMQALARESESSLDLAEGPMLRVVYFDCGAARAARLLIVIHHLVVDAIAWRVLLEDMQLAYTQLRAGQRVQLPAATTSFGHWAERITRYAQSAELRNEVDYWSSVGQTSAGRLPVDCADGINTAASARAVSVELSVEQTRRLLYDLPDRLGTHINDVLLTALAQAMREWTGSAELLVDLNRHGREPLFEDIDLSRTVGWFTSIYPSVLTAAPSSDDDGGDGGDARAAILATQRQLQQIPGHGLGYSLLRYLCDDADVRRRLAAVPQPQVLFNYLGRNQPPSQQTLTFDVCSEERGAIAGPFRGSLHGAGQLREHLIDVLGTVADDRLQFQWLYSQDIHQESTIMAVAHSYIKTLSDLVDQV